MPGRPLAAARQAAKGQRREAHKRPHQRDQGRLLTAETQIGKTQKTRGFLVHWPVVCELKPQITNSRADFELTHSF